MQTQYQEIEIAGNVYQIGKLPAMTQFHVARRIAPVLMALGGAAVIAEKMEKGEGDATNLLSDALGPLVEALSHMTDADANYVVGHSLSVCSIKQGNTWAKLWGASGLQFQDLELPVMMQLVGRCIIQNLGNFTKALPAK